MVVEEKRGGDEEEVVEREGGEVERWVVLILVSELSGMEEPHGFRLDGAMDQTAAWLLGPPARASRLFW